MSSLLYFIDSSKNKKPISSAEDISISELRGILAGGSISRSGMPQEGPCGGLGWLFTCSPAQTPAGGKNRSASSLRYLEKEQKWTPVETLNSDGKTEVLYWIGYWLNDKPVAQDLTRDYNNLTDGYGLEINGSNWQIPIVRLNLTTLPKSFKLGPGGKVADQYTTKYTDISKEVERWYEKLLEYWDAETDEAKQAIQFPTSEEQYKICCEILAINYRVGLWECSGEVLDLVRTDTLIKILRIATGLVAIEEELISKKKVSIAGDGNAA